MLRSIGSRARPQQFVVVEVPSYVWPVAAVAVLLLPLHNMPLGTLVTLLVVVARQWARIVLNRCELVLLLVAVVHRNIWLLSRAWAVPPWHKMAPLLREDWVVPRIPEQHIPVDEHAAS